MPEREIDLTSDPAPEYTGWCWLSLLFCLPIGGVAIFYSKLTHLYNEDLMYKEAAKASRKTQIWMAIAYVAGGLSLILAIILRGR